MMLTLVRDIAWSSKCATSWCQLDWTFDFAVVTLTLKSSRGYISKTIRCTDTALKVSRALYCFTSSMSCGVENYFPRQWGTGMFDAVFLVLHFF